MAYVRKTETMIADVASNIRDMRNKALQPFAKADIQAGTTLHEAALKSAGNVIWKPAPHLRGKLPDEFMKEFSVLALSSAFGGEKVKTHLRGEFLFPPFSNDYLPTVTFLSEADMEPEFLSYQGESAARSEKHTKVVEQFATVERQVRNFLEHHSSLNAAIKSMPEIELYIPDCYLSKLRAPTPPREKVAKPSVVETLEIDVNALTATAIASRVT